MMSARPIALPLFVLLLAACGGVEHRHEQPERSFADSRRVGGSAPAVGEVDTGPSTTGRTVNEVVVDCERHIRSWEFASRNAASQRERESLEAIRESLLIYVRQNMDQVREAALTGDPRARGIASTALGFSDDVSALPILLNNLSDPSNDVVANTLFGLGVLASPATPAGALQDAIRRPGASAAVVANGVFAASQIARARARDQERGQRNDGLDELLIHLLDRPEPEVRAQAAAGLGYARVERALPLLYNLLAGDPERDVRFAAAFALGEIGASDAGPSLVAALDDPESRVGGAARAALKKLYGRDYGPDPKAWSPVVGG